MRLPASLLHCCLQFIGEKLKPPACRFCAVDMSELRLIVEKLNAPPFSSDPPLSLVSLDEKADAELIGIFNNVLAKCDAATHDVEEQKESEEIRVFRQMDFLQVMRYKFPPDTESFRKGLGRGERSVMYPLLHWSLSNFENLKKRA